MSQSAESIAESRYSCPTCRAVFRTGLARCPLDGTRLALALLDPLLDTIIADRYLIEELIGEGAMGRVYRVRHKRVSRRFALKVLFGDHASDPTMRKRFAREAEAASRLAHPNVISVIDFGATTEGLLYLVMDHVEGRELSDIIDEEGPLDAERVARIARQLAGGLAHAHGHGLVHRDFKSSNVLISGPVGAETAHIVDFGMAVLAEPEERAGVRLTTDGTMVGTLAYMAPEQASGAPVDGRTDLFSLGVVIYEMLAGVLPFEGPPLAMARQNLAVEPPIICDRVPGLEVSPVLELLSNRLMAKKPEDRYQRGEDVVAAIDSGMAVESEPPAAASPSPGAIAEIPEEPEPSAVLSASEPTDARAPSEAEAPVTAESRGDEPEPRRVAEPRRYHTTQVIPLAMHGRTLFIALACAVSIGFAITVLVTRGRQRAESAPASEPTSSPALAAVAPPAATATPSPVVPAAPPSPAPTLPPASPADPPVVDEPVAAAAAPARTSTARTRPARPTSGRSAPRSTSTDPGAGAPPPTTTSSDPLAQARGLLARGDTGAAIKLVERELLDTPGRPALYELLGDARARTGNRIAAIAAYRRYLALVGDADPSDRTRRVRTRLQQLGGL